MRDPTTSCGDLLTLLADGKPHTIAMLAGAAALSDAQLQSLLEELRNCGVELHFTESGSQVAWHDPAVLLTAAELRSHLAAHSRKRIAALSIDTVCASTNERVKDAGLPGHGQYHVALAEYQSAGRGRRGREWRSPLAGGICMTVAVRYPVGRKIDSALTLALGIAVCEALTPLVNTGVLLKWPNDVLIDGRKLGGILTELVDGHGAGPVVLIGIGINVKLPAHYSLHLQSQALTPTGLAPYLREDLTRAVIAARILDRIVTEVEAYWVRGFSPLAAKWQERDYLRGQAVQAITGTDIIQGIAEGVNEEGALVVNVDGTRHYLNSGEVSVRAG